MDELEKEKQLLLRTSSRLTLCPCMQIFETPSTEAPRGKPTKHSSQLEKGSPAAMYDGNDSYSAAAMKVGSILVGAGAITWFGVPLFMYLVRLVLPG